MQTQSSPKSEYNTGSSCLFGNVQIIRSNPIYQEQREVVVKPTLFAKLAAVAGPDCMRVVCDPKRGLFSRITDVVLIDPISYLMAYLTNGDWRKGALEKRYAADSNAKEKIEYELAELLIEKRKVVSFNVFLNIAIATGVVVLRDVLSLRSEHRGMGSKGLLFGVVFSFFAFMTFKALKADEEGARKKALINVGGCV